MKSLIRKRFPKTYLALREGKQYFRYLSARPQMVLDRVAIRSPDVDLASRLETEELDYVRKRLGPDWLFVDIGANVGVFTCTAASLAARVLAFEPSSENLRYLFSNVVANGLKNVEVFPLAVGDHVGIVDLFGSGTGASMIPGWAGQSTQFHDLVSMTTLDTVWPAEQIGQPSLIKLDVEGAELAVLEGATTVVQASPAPEWIVEVSLGTHEPVGRSPRYPEVFRYFWSYGYEAVDFETRTVISEGQLETWGNGPRPPSQNFLFRKPAQS